MFSKPIHGGHVALIFGSAFSVIIAVNLTLATQAVRTFPGLEVKNSYVASQSFDADRAAQQALGWDIALTVDPGSVTLSITDADGPVVAQSVQGTLGRATHVSDDQALVFVRKGGDYIAASAPLAPGNWNLRLTATAADGTPFRQRIPFRVAK